MRYSIIDRFAAFWSEARLRIPRGWIVAFFALAGWLALMVLGLALFWVAGLWA